MRYNKPDGDKSDVQHFIVDINLKNFSVGRHIKLNKKVSEKDLDVSEKVTFIPSNHMVLKLWVPLVDDTAYLQPPM